MFARRRKKKTDYNQRLKLLKSEKPRLVVRRSLNNIHAQIIEYDEKGDRTVLEEISKNLNKYGWKGHGGNITSAYLVGLLIGSRALKKGIKEANLDIGLQVKVKQNALFSAALGAKDAGLSINLGKEVSPSKERISGEHIAKYAEKLSKEDKEKYTKQFSDYIKKGIEPEKLPEHFSEVKNKIMEEFKDSVKKKAELKTTENMIEE